MSLRGLFPAVKNFFSNQRTTKLVQELAVYILVLHFLWIDSNVGDPSIEEWSKMISKPSVR